MLDGCVVLAIRGGVRYSPTMADDVKAPATANRAGEPRYPGGSYAWYVVGVLVLAYTFSFIDRQILSLLVGPIRRDLGINDTQMSPLQGLSFAVFYTLMGLPIGRMVDTRSRRGGMISGVVVWSLMTMACGLARSFWHLFAARVGVGVGEAALSPAAYSLLADSFRPRRLGAAIGVYSMGIYIGAGVALIVGGKVIGAMAGITSVDLPILGATRPWQLVFFAVGAPGLLVALLMFLTVREPARRGMAKGGASVRAVAAYVAKNRATFACHNIGYALLALISYGAGAWIPTLLMRSYGFTPQRAGVDYGIIGVVFGTLGVVAGGVLGDRFVARGWTDGRMRVGLLGAVLALVPLALFPLVSDPRVALGLAAPATFFLSLGFGAGPAAIQEIVPSEMRGQASAIYIFVTVLLGMGLGPTSIALLTDYVFKSDLALRYSLITVSLTVVPFAAILFYLGLAPYRRTRSELARSIS